MKSVVTYVRNLFGWCNDDLGITSFKRDRPDEFAADDVVPSLKRLRKLNNTTFPETMVSRDIWQKSKDVRCIPIKVETGHPCTSTPIEEPNRLASRLHRQPIKLIETTSNGKETPYRKPRLHTPIRPVIHSVINDNDEEEDEVTLVETKPTQRKPRVYIDVDEDDEVEDDDVIFVKRVKSPPQTKPYKFFVAKDKEETQSLEDDNLRYYKICRKLNDRNTILSPRIYNHFKPTGSITKTYKKAKPIPKWMQALNSGDTFPNSKNVSSALSEVYNLNEKQSYLDLIKRVTGVTDVSSSFSKPLNFRHLAQENASFRKTLQSQKSSLNEIKLLEKDFNTEKENEITQEYDPITVASINSSDSEVEVITSDASTSSSVKIVPINTLKDSYKGKDITANDWLKKLDSKYKKRRQDIQDKLKDAHRESEIISKVNYEQKLAQLEHKLKHELSIPESLIEEAQPTVELPPLTAEQQVLVKKALGAGPAGQLFIEKFNLRIHRRDLQTLAGLNWLNDEVINFYMNLLMQRSEERSDLPKVYATNTFFYPKLMQSGQAGLRRWTRKVDIFAHDLVVVPVHLGVHWCLSIIDFRDKVINYLDSMGSRNQKCLDALLQYLRDEHQDKKGKPFDDSNWKTQNLKDIPQQMNGSDCGMFACTFAEFSCRNAPYTFSQAHMPYLRHKAALEIITGKLLL